MSEFKSFLFFFLLNLNICLGTFIMGFFLTVFNPLQGQLSHLYNWNDSKSFFEGLITALIPLGAILANLFSSHFIGHFGRKASCLIVDTFCILSTIFTLFSMMPLLIIGRFLCGVAVGVNSVLVGIYMKEISPLAHVHFFSALGGFMLNFGMVVSFLFGINTLDENELDSGVTDNWWRVMFAFPIAVSFLRSFCILVFFNYESPYFLITKNREEEALKVLKRLYKGDEKIANEVFSKAKKRVEKSFSTQNLKYQELFGKKYLMRFLIAITLAFGNQYSGVNAIAFYSKSLFTSLGGSDSTANTLNGILGVVMLLSGLLIALPLKYLGIRKTYLMSCLGSALMLGMVSLCVLLNQKLASLLFIFGYYFFFSIGIGPIIFMIIPQLLPEKYVSVVFTFFWILAFIIGLTFPIMLESKMGVDGSFLFFACCCLCALVFNFFSLPDTTGKTSEEVEVLFDRKNIDGGLLEQKMIDEDAEEKLTMEDDGKEKKENHLSN